MRYVLTFWFAFALTFALMAGCTEDGGEGGSGGAAGTGGTGGMAGTGGTAGTGGMAGTGGSGGMPECQGPEDCEDGEECTTGTCSEGMCEYTAVADGTACADGRGGCYGGLCNFVPVSVAFGAREVVFDWSTESCEEFDIPDGPAKAVRASNGEIVLFGTMHETGNYLNRGNDFDSLEHDCENPAHRSANLPTPESYENNEWLWSPYRVGASWHVLIHNEFHDPVAINCSPSYLCWYNSITYGVSTDGARTFVKPSPPAHVVAPAPRVWVPPDTPDWKVDGYMEPTNIVLGPDDYYYALMALKRIDGALGTDVRGVCAIRTKTLDNPASWRARDGHGFNLALQSPYVAGGEVPQCAFLEDLERQGAGALTYNTYVERYMNVKEWGLWLDDQTLICGFFFTLSTDLIHWSHIQLIARAHSGWCDDTGGPGAPPILDQLVSTGPAIIDHADSTANFERPGQTPYLYYIRHNGGLDRDLVRVPLTFALEE